MLFLDGVYTRNRYGKTRFQRTIAPNQQELAKLIHTISHRVARFLERQGILERDEENSYLQLDGMDEDPMQQLIGCSVSYRIALGPQQGRHDPCDRSCASCACGISASMHVIFEPLDFISKLASLVPKPRVNLTRFHGVFVGVPHHPNSKHRTLVTPARRGKNLQEENKTQSAGPCPGLNA